MSHGGLKPRSMSSNRERVIGRLFQWSSGVFPGAWDATFELLGLVACEGERENMKHDCACDYGCVTKGRVFLGTTL
jgi:hypothetical protein